MNIILLSKSIYRNLFRLIFSFFFLFIILLAPKFLKAQEEITHYSVNEFNGVWRNQVDTSGFYLFKDGKYLAFYIDYKNNKPNLIDQGIYGFYSGELNNKIYEINDTIFKIFSNYHFY